MTLQEQIRANRWRTLLVLFGFAVLIAAMGLALSAAYDPSMLGVMGVVGIVYGLISWFGSGRIIASTSGARKTERSEYPELHRAVENACIAAGMAPPPPVYVIDDPSPNAFAAGRNPKTAYVAATTGLIQLMDERELQGVMAHEIAHVRNRDVRLMSLAAVLVGVIMLITDMLMRISFLGGGGRRDNNMGAIGMVIGIAALIIAPIAAMMLQMALSRRREFLADASAVEMTGDAEGLARALHKLGSDHNPLRKVTRATAHMYIESPLRDQPALRSSLGGMFNTHPPLQARISRLCEVGGLDPVWFDLGPDDPEAGQHSAASN